MAEDGRGIGRFALDLPAVKDFVSLGEGSTPLLPLPRLAGQLGLASLSAKLETQNPTGSYKDRVAAMSLSLAKAEGKAGWIATSSGNAGLSMAAYGTRAGMPGFLCLVASAPLEKKLPLMPYSIGIATIEGVGTGSTATGDTTLFNHVLAAASSHNLYLGITAHAFNSEGMRGIDTIGYELADQAPRTTHVYVPTGGGGLATAIARGLRTRGATAKVVICQPSGCAPIARYLAEQLETPTVQRCESAISALQVPHPPDGASAAQAAVRSGGWGTAIPDTAILSAQRLLATAEGVFAEPASAAGLAALVHDVKQGKVGGSQHIVLVVTGAGWKDISRFTDEANALPVADLGTVPQAINRWASHTLTS